jgi:NO-binding membrane sensor protein with MHYT domain
VPAISPTAGLRTYLRAHQAMAIATSAIALTVLRALNHQSDSANVGLGLISIVRMHFTGCRIAGRVGSRSNRS